MDDPNADVTTSTPTPTQADAPPTGGYIPPSQGAVPPSPGAVPPPVTSAPPATSAPPPSWAPVQPHRDEGGRWVGIVAGIILLGVGLWFFADRTLGLDMPDISWDQAWPLILILIGAAILFSAFRRERR